MIKGWVKLHRRLTLSNMYRSLTSKQRDVMIQLLLMANHEENEWEWKGKIYTCKPGQFITSLPSIQKRCAKDVSIKNIRTAMFKLEKWGFLAEESAGSGRLVTILKWDTYQSDDLPTGRRTGRQPADNRQTTGRQPAANKNDIRMIKNKEEGDTPPIFELFRLFYPNELKNPIPTPPERKALREALEMMPVDDWKPYIAEMHRRGEQKQIKWFFAGDFRKYGEPAKKKPNKKEFKKANSGYYRAYCAKCGRDLFPREDQLYKSTECCGVEMVPEKPKKTRPPAPDHERTGEMMIGEGV